MFEVTVFESGLEIGTFDLPEDDIGVGSVIMGTMEILTVELNPTTGEDAVVTVQFI